MDWDGDGYGDGDGDRDGDCDYDCDWDRVWIHWRVTVRFELNESRSAWSGLSRVAW